MPLYGLGLIRTRRRQRRCHLCRFFKIGRFCQTLARLLNHHCVRIRDRYPLLIERGFDLFSQIKLHIPIVSACDSATRLNIDRAIVQIDHFHKRGRIRQNPLIGGDDIMDDADRLIHVVIIVDAKGDIDTPGWVS